MKTCLYQSLTICHPMKTSPKQLLWCSLNARRCNSLLRPQLLWLECLPRPHSTKTSSSFLSSLSHYLNHCYILFVHVSPPLPVEKLSCSIQRNKYWQRNWPAKLTEYKILMEKTGQSKKTFSTHFIIESDSYDSLFS